MVINKYLAETVGTYILVGIGSMAILAVTATGGPLVVAVAFAFGLALLAGIYAVGDISGGHFNPAVTLAAFLDKRVDMTDLIGYWIGQLVGALLASLTVLAVAEKAGVQSTYTRLGAGVEAWEGFLVEAVLTAIFVLVILVSTKRAASTAAMAISLTLVAVHLVAAPLFIHSWRLTRLSKRRSLCCLARRTRHEPVAKTPARQHHSHPGECHGSRGSRKELCIPGVDACGLHCELARRTA